MSTADTPSAAFLPETRVEEIRARLNAATPAPWTHGRDDMQSYHAGTGEAYTAVYADNPAGRMHLGFRMPFIVARAYDETGRNKADAKFIAHAPDDIRDLLADRDRLQRRVEELEAGLRERTRLLVQEHHARQIARNGLDTPLCICVICEDFRAALTSETPHA